ncbi:MAG: 6-phosphofructokinase [Oscillospiraceae bacterium]|nr:6-phosphofructokinase [Oscillospiraceae bacterium]
MPQKTIGVLTSGGDAPGMNAAVRAVVRSALKHDYKVFGVYRGYNGLIKCEMVDMSIRMVSGIIHRGGTLLRTARCPEFTTEEGMQKAKENCMDIGIECLVVIGGDGSFKGGRDIAERGIPVIGIPGTIDNDIQCTEYTIGFDSAMNTAMEMIDKLRDTTQSHYRCSVIEVMGRHAGHIALHTGIACGASYIIIPEIKYEIGIIVEKIKLAQRLGRKHFIVLVAEGIGNVTEIAALLENATGVESRATILGHVQRGGNPSVRDRVFASQMGYHAVKLIEEGKVNRVVGLQSNRVVDFDIHEALSMKKEFDHELYNIADEIAF